MSIGVLVTSHRRPHTLRPQLAALDGQTVKPDRIVIWHNDGGEQPDVEAMRGREVVACNFNSGVWPRFSFCLWGFDTKYVLVLDDDTVPAPGFIQHLLECYAKRRGLYGVNGVTFLDGTRGSRAYTGVFNPQSCPVEVDIVGHAWFCERPLLMAMAGMPKPDGIDTAGEDYALAFAAQRVGFPVIVPPSLFDHDKGSTRPDIGTDDKALYKQPGEEEKKQRVHDFYLSQGWMTLWHIRERERQRGPSISDVLIDLIP